MKNMEFHDFISFVKMSRFGSLLRIILTVLTLRTLLTPLRTLLTPLRTLLTPLWHRLSPLWHRLSPLWHRPWPDWPLSMTRLTTLDEVVKWDPEHVHGVPHGAAPCPAPPITPATPPPPTTAQARLSRHHSRHCSHHRLTRLLWEQRVGHLTRLFCFDRYKPRFPLFGGFSIKNNRFMSPKSLLSVKGICQNCQISENSWNIHEICPKHWKFMKYSWNMSKNTEILRICCTFEIRSV